MRMRWSIVLSLIYLICLSRHLLSSFDYSVDFFCMSLIDFLRLTISSILKCFMNALGVKLII